MTADLAGTFKIEINDETMYNTTSLIVFEANLDRNPLMNTTANVYINTLEPISEEGESDFKSVISKNSKPYLTKFGGELSSPIIVNSGDEDSTDEFDLGELIVQNYHGQIKVEIEVDEKTPFIKLIKVG